MYFTMSVVKFGTLPSQQKPNIKKKNDITIEAAAGAVCVTQAQIHKSSFII